jgi:hypothetical protein
MARLQDQQDSLVEAWIKANRPEGGVTVDEVDTDSTPGEVLYLLTDGTVLTVIGAAVAWDDPPEPTLHEMTEDQLCNAYRHKFGAGTLPHTFLLSQGEIDKLMERMRQALRTGQPLPPDPRFVPTDGTVI